MHRITITLSEELALVVSREAERLGTSVSEIVRRALAEQLGMSMEASRKLPFAAIGRSGKRHTARNAEQILRREWVGARHR